MRVLRLKFKTVGSVSNFQQLECEVVDKPFTWVIKNGVMPCSQDVDPGPIDPDSIPLPLFENWKEFGATKEGRSEIIPDLIDLNAHSDAASNLRLFGTIKLVEVINRNEFQQGDVGLKAYLQMLLKTKYIKNGTTFGADLLPAAEETLKVWDKESIFAFIANVLGKKLGGVSVADVAHVVKVLTGKDIDIDAKSFNVLQVAQELPTHVASANRPDEFFNAAFPCEIMEYDIAKTLLVDAEDDYYFGKGAQHPKYWGVNGPGNVLWRAEVHKASPPTVEWAPVAGTLFERAIESKQKLFGSNVDNQIPFTTPLDGCSVLDSGMYPVSPREFNTGVRYLTMTQNLPVYKVCLTSVDSKTLIDELNRIPITRLSQDPTVVEIRDEIIRVYNNETNRIVSRIGDKHFMVYKKLGGLAEDPAEIDNWSAKESDAERLETYILPGMPNNVRAIVAYTWVLMHMMSESLCYEQAANDDFTLEAAVEYCLEVCLEKQKTRYLYLVNCIYSEPLGGIKKNVREVVGMQTGFKFDAL